MEKTGSSSIQRYLAMYGNDNPRYINGSFGRNNSGVGLVHLFFTNPLDDIAYKIGWLQAKDLEWNRREAMEYMEGYVEKAYREQKPLLFS